MVTFALLLFTDVSVKQGEDEVTICMEDQLRSLGIISNDYELSPTSILDDKVLKRISGGASVPQKKVRISWNTDTLGLIWSLFMLKYPG